MAADGEGESLAQWLKEAGRRAQRAAPAPEDSGDTYNSPASLHHYLEELAGKPLRYAHRRCSPSSTRSPASSRPTCRWWSAGAWCASSPCSRCWR